MLAKLSVSVCVNAEGVSDGREQGEICENLSFFETRIGGNKSSAEKKISEKLAKK